MYDSTYLMLLYFEQKKENKKKRNQQKDELLDTYPSNNYFINRHNLLHNNSVTFKSNMHTHGIHLKNNNSIKNR